MRFTRRMLVFYSLLPVWVEFMKPLALCGSNAEEQYFKLQDPSSFLPWLPNRLVSNGSRSKTKTTCAIHSVTRFKGSQGFLYNSETGLCSPLLWLEGPSSPGARPIQPEEGDMYLSNREWCGSGFKLFELSNGELVCLKIVKGTVRDYWKAKTFCVENHAYIVSVKTIPKLEVIKSLANSKKFGLVLTTGPEKEPTSGGVTEKG